MPCFLNMVVIIQITDANLQVFPITSIHSMTEKYNRTKQIQNIITRP